MASSRVKRRVGVFGGTFDPIHAGHVEVAHAVLKALCLDRVLFVVTSDQWLREHPPVASAVDRFRMVEIAVENDPEFTASKIDILREGSTYTVDTLNDLTMQLGDSVTLYLIVGADSALSMDQWKDAGEIARLASVVVVGRPGLEFGVESLGEPHPASGAEYVEGPMIDVSATCVRDLLSENRPVSGLVAEAVGEYIEKQGLYRE